MAHRAQPEISRSPYKPGNGLEPPYLGDRGPQLERFRSFLAESDTPHNVLVRGLRGVGKTVLLERYSVEAREAGWLVVDREFSEADAEPSLFAQRVLTDLTRLARDLSLSRRLKDTAGALLEHVSDLLGTLSVSYGEVEVTHAPGGRSSSARAGMLDDDLLEVLQQISGLCRGSDHPGFILRYDEFHVVREKSGTLTLSALLTAIAAAQRRGVPILLILCGLPSIQENLARSKSYSERMFAVEEIGNLRPPEDRRALAGPAEARGRQYDPAAIDAVLDDTLGYPYFIQLYGDALWKGTGTKRVITLDDFHRLRPGILEALDRSFFESRYYRASSRERRLLRAIAQHGELATSGQIRKDLRLTNSELQPLLRYLVDKGLIYRPSRGRVAFTAPMFGAYLRRRSGSNDTG